MENTIKKMVKNFNAECVKLHSEFCSAKAEWMEKFKMAEAYIAMSKEVDTPWGNVNRDLFLEFTAPAHDIMCQTAHEIYSKMHTALMEHELFVRRLETAWGMVNDENNADKWQLQEDFRNWVHNEWSNASIELDDMADQLKEIDSLVTKEWGKEWLNEQTTEW